MTEKNNKNILYCSFCGKSQHEVRKLIAGPTVFICDECVELCMDIIKEENKDSFVKNQEGVPTPQEICKVLDDYVIGQTYAKQVLSALDSGKHIFVEKPLAINSEQLSVISEKMLELGDPPILMVGFNRRFAPHVVKMKSLLGSRREPKSITITVNAGDIPADHWTQDPEIGGGRIIGEACHYIDLMRFLSNSPIN